MTPPTPDRAAADRAAFYEWRDAEHKRLRSLGWVPSIENDRAYLAGAEHGRANPKVTVGRTVRSETRPVPTFNDDETPGERIAELTDDLATARADLEHARKARKGFQELYEASCREVVANCERAEKAEGDLARVKAELAEAKRERRIANEDTAEARDRAHAAEREFGRMRDELALVAATNEANLAQYERYKMLYETASAEVKRVAAERDEAREDLSVSQDARYRLAKAMESTPAPRPDEAEALRQRALQAGSAWWKVRRELRSGERVPGGIEVDDVCGEFDAAYAALDRASSPAPSPVEAEPAKSAPVSTTPVDTARATLMQAATKQLYECELRGREAKEYREACKATDKAAYDLREVEKPDPMRGALTEVLDCLDNCRWEDAEKIVRDTLESLRAKP